MTSLSWLTFLLRSLTMTLTVLLFWIYFFSSDAIICSTLAFPTLGNPDHVVVSVSIDFQSNSNQDSLFHGIAYSYSCADWDSLCDNLRDVPWWISVLLLLLVNFVSGFRLELISLSLIGIRSSIHLNGFQLHVLLP